MAKLVTGQKWARLECVKFEVEKFEVKRGAITDRWEEPAYTLKCECGKTVVVLPKDFVGKRAMRDCGCGLSKDDGAYVLIAFSAPTYIRELITTEQAKRKSSFSNAAVEIIKAGASLLEGKEARNG